MGKIPKRFNLKTKENPKNYNMKRFALYASVTILIITALYYILPHVIIHRLGGWDERAPKIMFEIFARMSVLVVAMISIIYVSRTKD
jgi:membrane protein DedA with SNARE-associated domain